MSKKTVHQHQKQRKSRAVAKALQVSQILSAIQKALFYINKKIRST